MGADLNVLLIACDTLRVDHIGCYGYFRDTTPNIDMIARDGVIFNDFYNAGTPTGPAFTCIYTGLHAIRHRFYDFIPPNVSPLNDTIFTLPEIMRLRGYTTAALDNLMNFPSHPKHFARGYEFYINASSGPFTFPPFILAEQVNKRLIPWIKSCSGERFFLFVHYWDPHLPYSQPKEYRELFHHNRGDLSDLEVKEATAGYQYVPGWGKVDKILQGEKVWHDRGLSVDLYDGEIRYMDDAIGEVVSTFEEEDILDDTLIIVTSDHGEQLGQHYNFWGHASLHDSVTHIPLIMRYPKSLPRGVRVSGLAQHIDLLPTILELTDCTKKMPNIDGKSLLPLLRGERNRGPIFMEHTWRQRAVRTVDWKFIEFMEEVSRAPLLFNMKTDPMEDINLTYEENIGDHLKNILHEWVRANIAEGEVDPILLHDLKTRTKRNLGFKARVKELNDLVGTKEIDLNW